METKEEIYNYLIFIKNNFNLNKDNFILEVFKHSETLDTNKDFYNYLKKEKIINRDQDIEFRILMKNLEFEKIDLYDLFCIISKNFNTQKINIDEKIGTLTISEIYAVLAGFLEENNYIKESLIESIKNEIKSNGFNYDFIKEQINQKWNTNPFKIPEIEKQEGLWDLTDKTKEDFINCIETIEEILDENMTKDNIIFIKKVLDNMNKILKGDSYK